MSTISCSIQAGVSNLESLFSSNLNRIPMVYYLGYGMVWYGMVWYGMVWHGMAWYGMVWYCMVWYGMVWYDMVWYGMAWYGMVWYHAGQVCHEPISCLQVTVQLSHTLLPPPTYHKEALKCLTPGAEYPNRLYLIAYVGHALGNPFCL